MWVLLPQPNPNFERNGTLLLWTELLPNLFIGTRMDDCCDNVKTVSELMVRVLQHG